MSDKNINVKSYGLTEPQKYIWMTNKIAPEMKSYVVFDALYAGELNPDAALAAVDRLYKNCQALRAEIAENGGAPEQTFREYVQGQYGREIKSFRRLESYKTWAGGYAKQKMDGALVEITIIQIENAYGIFVKGSHIVLDGRSCALLAGMFAEYYAKFISGGATGGGAEGGTGCTTNGETEGVIGGEEGCEEKRYTDFIERERAYYSGSGAYNGSGSDHGVGSGDRGNGGAYARDRAYWRDKLSQIDTPTRLPAAGGHSVESDRLEFGLPPGAESALDEFGRNNKLNEFEILLTCFALCVAAHLNNANPVILCSVLNRIGAAENRTPGMYVNLIPVLFDCRRENYSAGSAAGYIKSAGKEFLGAAKHFKYGYNRILEDFYELRGHQRPSEIIFNYQNVDMGGANNAVDAKFSTSWHADGTTSWYADGTTSWYADGTTSWYADGTQMNGLTLNAVRGAGRGLRFALDYQVEKFSREEIEIFASHFSELLGSMTENSGAAISLQSMIGAKERERIFSEFNDTRMEYRQDMSLAELFEEHAARAPGAEALEYSCAAPGFGGGTMTYAELNAKANRLARRLRAAGVGPGDRVALIAGRSMELIIGILGILKSGGAYVPIDPDYPEDRIRYMLEDSAPKAVLTYGAEIPYGACAAITDNTDSCVCTAITDNTDSCVCTAITDNADSRACAAVLDLADAGAYAEDGENLERVNRPDDLAYVIYTSGTTGRPKGVMIERRGVANLRKHFETRLPTGAGDCVLQFASVSFDAHVSELLMSLAAGAKLMLIDKADAMDPDRLSEIARAHKVTVLILPPQLLSRIDAPYARIIITAGSEAIPESAAGLSKSILYSNEYGPTETTVCATHWAGPRDWDKLPQAIPIGRPIANTHIYIMNGMDPCGIGVPGDYYGIGISGEFCGIGVPGELCIAGDGLAKGYMNMPELTAEKFVLNDLTGSRIYRTGDLAKWQPNGSRIYRTGDLAKWLPDGNIMFLGRLDAQVKIRGFRIELGEITAALRKLPGVADAAVTVRDIAGEKCLCAYVIPKADSASELSISSDSGSVSESDKGPESDSASDLGLDPAGVRNALRRELPDYMIPAYITLIDALPLNNNGKPDLDALPEPDTQAGRGYVEPRNEAERAIAGAFEEALGVAQVGSEDDFFMLGGHSLKAAAAVNAIERRSGIRLPIKAIFDSPTPAALAKTLAAHSAGAFGSSSAGVLSPAGAGAFEPISASPIGSIAAIPKAEKKAHYAATSAQKRLYALDQLEGGGVAYNMPMAIEADGAPDPAAAQRALGRLIERHEALRTRFAMAEGETVQIIEEEAHCAVEYEESENFTDADAAGFIRPFDLGRAPLIRVKIINIPKNNRYILLFDMHHIISDAVTADILTDDFSKFYAGEEPPPQETQYKDYSEWALGRDLSGQGKYWKEIFADGAPVLDLAADYPRLKTPSGRGARVRAALGRERTGAIADINRKYGATDYMTLLAAFFVEIHKYSRQEDIVVGTPISGRAHPDTAKIAGMFVNTLALRAHPERGKTFAAFLAEVKERALGAFENREYAFEELIKDAEARRGISRNPLFDVMFAARGAEESKISLGAAKLRRLEIARDTAKFDLTLQASRTTDGYELELEYRTDLFTEAGARNMLAHYIKLLDSIAENPEAEIGELRMTDGEERELILGRFNDTGTEYPREKTVAQLFEEQAGRTPDGAAAAYEDESLTYRELNERANALAHRLRGMGAGPDDFVGIIAGRGLETVAGILGIVKAGAAYVPIDPAYPADRIRRMLAECKPKALLLAHRETKTAVCETAAGASALTDAPVINLFEADAWRGETANPDIINKPNDLLYCIFTSGTTGKPKGSLIEHKSVARLVIDADYIILDENTVILQTGSISFDASTFEIWGALLNGGKLVLAGDGTIMDADKLKAAIEKHAVNTLWITSTLFNQMVTADPSLFGGLEYVLTGGEKLSESHVRLFKEHNVSTILINCYGPTENTTFTTAYEIPARFETLPIGRPIGNTRVYIMDGGELCGIGAPGELLIAGDGLARSYLNQPELTAEKFIPDPFDSGWNNESGNQAKCLPNGGRLYKSGDLARWLPDGNIDFLGRIDAQLKIRGFRIEPGEIENALRRQPGVADAAVVARETGGGKSLCAYLIRARGAPEPDVKGVRRALALELPDYMIPAYMTVIEELPVNRSGKLNAGALPDPGPPDGRAYAPPETGAERAAAAVFEEILGTSPVGMDDGFFELGGDSIKAIRAASKLRDMGYELTATDFMRSGTIRQLCANIVKRGAAPEFEQGEVNGEIPLTPVQLDFFRRNHAAPRHFNQSLMLKRRERFDVPRLKEAIAGLARHHDALRNAYPEPDDTPGGINAYRQITLPARDSKLYGWAEFDFTSEANPAPAVNQACGAIQAGFDLAAGPLLKAALFHTAEADHLFLCAHHLVIDGVSWRILLEDLFGGYSQALRNEKIALPKKTSPYRDWAEALARYAESGELAEEAAYWENVALKAANAPPLADGGSAGGIYKTLRLEIDPETTRILLREAGNRFGTRTHELLLAALAVAAGRWKGRKRLTVEVESHGRAPLFPELAIDRTVGWFTAIYPVVLEPAATVEDTIIAAKEELRKVPRGGTGHGVLIYLGGRGELGVKADITFNYHGVIDGELDGYEGISASELPRGADVSEKNAAGAALCLNGSVTGGRLAFDMAYDSGLYGDGGASAFTAAYESALRGVAEACASGGGAVATPSDYGIDISLDALRSIEEIVGSQAAGAGSG